VFMAARRRFLGRGVTSKVVIDREGARAVYYPDFIPQKDATELFDVLRCLHHWESKPIRLFGKMVTQPRMITSFSDPGVKYRYTNVTNEGHRWIPELEELRRKLEAFVGQGKRFNFCLLNLYRNGSDYMGWHCDDEREMEGPIASVSLGETRDFVFKEKANRTSKHFLELESGSLLVMNEETQKLFLHSLPRRAKVQNCRINLTFRCIVDPRHDEEPNQTTA